jgi:TonB family protein
LILAAGLLAAAPAFGQTNPTANASAWDAFTQFYPPRALAAHEEGAVGFKVTLDSQGAVTKCEVTHSSGHPLLDQETCNVITLHAQFKPDANIGASQTRTHDGMIAWKLPGSAAALSRPKAVASTAAPEKVVCKKTVRTGSLAGFERTCMTPTEWAKQADESKQPWEELQGKKGSTSGN